MQKLVANHYLSSKTGVSDWIQNVLPDITVTVDFKIDCAYETFFSSYLTPNKI